MSGQKLIVVPVFFFHGFSFSTLVSGLASLEALPPHESVPPDLGVETLRGEGVDHRDPHAVEPAGNRVGPLLELAAGMEGPEHDGQCRLLGLGVEVDGDPSPVVDHPHSAIGKERDLDASGEAGHGLVDGVVDYLPDEVMKPARRRSTRCTCRAVCARPRGPRGP